jgi:hypothetical protein
MHLLKKVYFFTYKNFLWIFESLRLKSVHPFYSQTFLDRFRLRKPQYRLNLQSVTARGEGLCWAGAGSEAQKKPAAAAAGRRFGCITQRSRIKSKRPYNRRHRILARFSKREPKKTLVWNKNWLLFCYELNFSQIWHWNVWKNGPSLINERINVYKGAYLFSVSAFLPSSGRIIFKRMGNTLTQSTAWGNSYLHKLQSTGNDLLVEQRRNS